MSGDEDPPDAISTGARVATIVSLLRVRSFRSAQKNAVPPRNRPASRTKSARLDGGAGVVVSGALASDRVAVRVERLGKGEGVGRRPMCFQVRDALDRLLH